MKAVVEHLGVKPPFEIRDPDRRVHSSLWLARFFHFFEASGARIVLGLVFSSLLYILRIPIGLMVDLSQLDS